MTEGRQPFIAEIKTLAKGSPLASTLRRRWHAQGSYGGPKGAVAPMQGQCLDVANRMALGFLGQQGPEYLAPTHDRPLCLIKTVPTKMLTWDGVEWARRYVQRNNRSQHSGKCHAPVGLPQ